MARVVRRRHPRSARPHQGAGLYRSVAVPLDGTPEAEAAVEWGMAIASRTNASLHLLVMTREGSGLGPGRLRAAAVPSGYLEEVTARVGARADVRVRGLVMEGEAGWEAALTAHVRGRRVDLLVAAPGVGGQRWSVARLCERVPAPVLVVSEGSPDGERFRRILVPLDGTKPAERILPFVASLAGLLDGRVTLLTVLAPSYVIGASGSRGGAAVDCSVSPKRRAAQTYLDGIAQALRRQGRSTTTRVLVRARPARAIVDFVASEGIGLLAMSGAGCSKRNVVMPEILRLLESIPVATLTYGPPASRVNPRLPPEEA